MNKTIHFRVYSENICLQWSLTALSAREIEFWVDFHQSGVWEFAFQLEANVVCNFARDIGREPWLREFYVERFAEQFPGNEWKIFNFGFSVIRLGLPALQEFSAQTEAPEFRTDRQAQRAHVLCFIVLGKWCNIPGAHFYYYFYYGKEFLRFDLQNMIRSESIDARQALV